MHYVIIGNSTGAVGCIEGIRQIDREGPITIISKEPYHTYARPLISYLLCGKTTREKMKYRPDDFYKKNHCRLISGRTAVKIHKEKKQIALDDGGCVQYDRLLLATGSRAFVPPMEGLETVQDKHTFLSLDDALQLEKTLAPQKKVLIIGAGLIGLKCAEGIRDKVENITVVDLAPHILPSILDDAAAKIVQSHLEKKGIQFLLSDKVAKFRQNQAMLESGRTVDFDVLVIAVGVRPNTELLADAAGAVERGILIDAHGRTVVPDIYAAGDCTQGLDSSSGQHRIMALLPNAYLQGECAGVNMAGGDKAFTTAIPLNAIGFWGMHIVTAGSYDGEAYVSGDGTEYKKLFVKDNRLTGFMLIGDVTGAGIYTSLIRSHTPLNTIDFELIRQRPQLMAFSHARRAELLGGVKV